MAEDSEASLNELIFLRIPPRILVSQERDHRLRHRHPANHQDCSPCCELLLRTLARAEGGTQSEIKNQSFAKRLSSFGLLVGSSVYPGSEQILLISPCLPSRVNYRTIGKRGSVSFHVDLSQTWLGSSVTARVREVPARKLR